MACCLEGGISKNYSFHLKLSCSPVAEFIDSVRKLKPALKWVKGGFEMGLKGGMVIPLFNPTLQLALSPVQDL